MILQSKMRVVSTLFFRHPSGAIVERGAAGHVVRIEQHAGIEGCPLVQFDSGALVWMKPEQLEAEPIRVIDHVGQTTRNPNAPDTVRSIAEARQRLTEALAQGEKDGALLTWLDEISAFAVVTFGFELEGGIHLTIESPGVEAYVLREQNDVRAAIDKARTEYNPEE